MLEDYFNNEIKTGNVTFADLTKKQRSYIENTLGYGIYCMNVHISRIKGLLLD